MNRRAILLPFIAFAFLGACKMDETNQVRKTEELNTTQPTLSSQKVRLETNKGNIIIELNAEKSPITVANFAKYVSSGHYDGTVFHRVIGDFMIQGGGFAVEGDNLVEKETGSGIKNESQNGLSNEIGTIAMARTPDPDSASAQFFINVSNNTNLNYPNGGGYTVFGKVIEGMNVVDQIKAVETGTSQLISKHPHTGQAIPSMSEDVPLEPIVIKHAVIE